MALRSVPMNNDKDKNDDGHEGLFRIKNKWVLENKNLFQVTDANKYTICGRGPTGGMKPSHLFDSIQPN